MVEDELMELVGMGERTDERLRLVGQSGNDPGSGAAAADYLLAAWQT